MFYILHHMIFIYGMLFFIFFKILIFWVVREIKGQKMVQNDKKFCLLISQEPYIIWLSFMVHFCKMIISPGVFFHFFKILIFQVVRGVKGLKLVQNDKKFCPLHAPYLRSHTSYDCHLWWSCVKL